MFYGLHNGNLLDYRNCIIGKNYTVKISDHAMYCGRNEADYYVSDTKARLPIRWMAWESLLLVSIFHPCFTVVKHYFLLPKYFMTKPHGPSCNCGILSPYIQSKFLLRTLMLNIRLYSRADETFWEPLPKLTINFEKKNPFACPWEFGRAQ